MHVLTRTIVPLRASTATPRYHLRPAVKQPPYCLTNQLPNTSFLKRFFFGPSASAEEMSAAKTQAQKLIDENPVVVFSKSYCPYCASTKSILSEAGAKPLILELDEIENGSAIQDALQEITNQRTVPNVFINHKHIGGNSQLQAKKSELPNLLKEAGAI